MKESLKSIVYKKLLDKLISCEFKPNTFVTEDMMIEVAGTSRTPVREALQRLEEDGFIRIFPKRGIYISELTTRTLREVFEIRKMSEPLIIRNYGYRIPRERAEKVFSAVRSAAENGVTEDCAGADRDIQDMLLDSCTNEYLTGLAQQMFDHSVRLRVGAGMDAYDMSSRALEYRMRFLQLIMEGSYEEAASLCSEILGETEQSILAALTRRGGRDI